MAGESPLGMMRADRPPMPRHAAAASRPRRRAWPFIAPVAGIVVLAVGWCGLWYYAASVADRTLAGWVDREAAAGRVYSCGSQGISGFPFSIAAHCVEAAAAVSSTQPPITIAASDITFTAQVSRPTVLVGEVTGPLVVASPGQPPNFTANWSLARMSVSGVPPNPDRVTISLVQPQLNRGAGANAATVFGADHAELQARVIDGSAKDHPVIDAVLKFTSATAPSLHPLLTDPLRGDIEIVLRGFKDVAPKPLAERFREMQAAGGSIEIKSLRIERPDAIVVGTGTLTVNERGRLDGTIRLAISGIESVVPQLGIDRLIGQRIDRITGTGGQPGQPQGLAALDRLVPGLSGVVRQGANASVIDNVKKMGQPTEIDNKPATALPLRFTDGGIYFGILRVGEVPALF